MIGLLNLNADPDILPSFAPSWRKHIRNCGMADYRSCKIGINPTDRGVRAYDAIGFVIVSMLCNVSGLRPVDHGQAGEDSLPHRIRSRPISPKGEGWKKQQDTEKSHDLMVIHDR